MRVATARVAFADYDLLQQDFPELREQALVEAFPFLHASRGESRVAAVRSILDGWLIRNAAFVSSSQAAQNEVNTPIETTGETVTVYRPPLYGRAVVVPSSGPGAGLLDVKGVGVAPGAIVSHADHSNGLLLVADALKEAVLERVVAACFRHARSRLATVPNYGVLDLGFHVRDPDGSLSPAGALVRRAHRRVAGGGDLPSHGSLEQLVKVEIEMLLRRYGFTSCSTAFVMSREGEHVTLRQRGKPAGRCTYEKLHSLWQRLAASESLRLAAINIQTTREMSLEPLEACLVDFCQYYVCSRFDDPVLSLVSDRQLRWGGLIAPYSARFVQPDPRLALPVDEWGRVVPTTGLPRGFGSVVSRLDLACVDAAQRFRAGDLAADGVRHMLEARVSSVVGRWPGGSLSSVTPRTNPDDTATSMERK